MQRKGAGFLHFAPELAPFFQFEVVVARMPRNLRRRDRHSPQLHAGELELHQIANPGDRSDFHLRREMCLQHLARYIRFHRQNETEFARHTG